MLSKDIEAASKPADTLFGLDETAAGDKIMVTNEHLLAVIAEALRAGANVDHWTWARIVIALAGPIAEAKASGKSLDDMRDQAECKNDWDDAQRTGFLSGLSADKIHSIFTYAAASLEKYFGNPDVWRTLMVVAASLPEDGTVEGSRIWAAFGSASIERGCPPPWQRSP